jgi:type IV pilus assembly protein PilV
MKTIHSANVCLGHRARSSAGFTLLEVLVVILVMSIGMLGIAGLQAATARYKMSAWSRASTAVLFSDFADRVRANPEQAGLSYFSSGAATSVSAYTLSANWNTQASETLTIAKDCLSTLCTAAERAAYDMMIWRQQIRRQLPQGAAIVSGNRTSGMTVSMMWYDKQFVDNDSALISSNSCETVNASSTYTAAARSNCCPDAAAAPAGVRCVNFSFVP